jgi:hypothetical protein
VFLPILHVTKGFDMKKTFKISAIAAAAVMMGSLSASAAIIDFTSNSTPLSNGSYTLSGDPVAPASDPDDTAPGALALSNGQFLAGENDGLGVRDDEFASAPPQSITITFNSNKRLTAVYFLDLFLDDNGKEVESGRVSLGTLRDPLNFASVNGTMANTWNKTGFAELTGLNMIGKSFTFWAGPANDGTGRPDGALAAIDVAPVPLPASALLLLGALGGLGAMRRRKKA